MTDEYKYIAGVDEAGRGPLLGSVVAAAVILDPAKPIPGLTDSKKLSEKKREQLYLEITENALAWSVAEATVEEIDQLNILQASMLAMKRAVEQLPVQADFVRVDGNRIPQLTVPAEAVVKGDLTEAEISAASIIAKVSRDRMMLDLHRLYPQYAIDQHKGYPTRLHLEMLQLHGPSSMHRKSFAPVKRLLGK